MKNINILSLVQAYDSLEDGSYANYLSYFGIEIRNEEIKDLSSLTNILHSQAIDKSIFNRFYVGYKIPQIAKEFDLLRFGKSYVINVELKSTSTEEKIQKQLIRNKYYLSYLGKPIHNFTFESDKQQLYYLNLNNTLDRVDITFLEQLLQRQENYYINDIDDLFNPSNYLVSPFNSTKKFLEDKYFLTQQQEQVKNNIINDIGNNTRANFISVTGSAGTGKTLLIYDIVKEIKKGKQRPLIIHCGYLNSGQDELKENDWEIIPIRFYKSYDLSNYDVVFIDEAQRIYPSQLTEMVEKIKLTNGDCVFSYDKVQTLAEWEDNRDIDTKINSIGSITKYRLSEKIRTNKEIATFIKTLFNNKKNLKILKKDNIELNFFQKLEDARDYLESLKNSEWEVLRFTPSQYNKEYHEQYSEIYNKNSHVVIGQEFENVAVVIDNYFTYSADGSLIYNGVAYYHPVRMLFQNITRTRKKLNLIIINNHELLNRCVNILQNYRVLH